jgi:hypothetical protein
MGGWKLRKPPNGDAEPKRRPSVSVPYERSVYKTYRSRRSVSFDDWLLDRELEQIAREKAKANGTSGPRYCDCRELLVNGERVACPALHNCEYVRARSELVPIAIERADKESGNCHGKGDWMGCFADAMEELARPLLNGNGMERGVVHRR